MAAPFTAFAYPLFGEAPCVGQVVSSPNAVADGNDLFSASAISANDAWTGGFFVNTTTHLDQPLFEHWNGTAWSVVPSPANGHSFIYSVSAVATNDVWAVGAYFNSVHGAYQTLIEHWNGTTWKIVASPNVDFMNHFLTAVTAVSRNNVWAVGSHRLSNGFTATLTEHWNGTVWSIVASPNVGTMGNSLGGVAAAAPNNVWTVGGSNGPNFYKTLAENWNGIKWNVVATPNATTSSNPLNAIALVSANDVWGIGDFYNGTVFKTLAEHWNGTSWSIIPSANMGVNQSVLFGAAAVSSANVWGVGEWQNGSFNNPYAMHWNGTAWATAAAPKVGAADSWFNGAGKIPGTINAWAVGGTSNANHTYHQTLIEKLHC